MLLCLTSELSAPGVQSRSGRPLRETHLLAVVRRRLRAGAFRCAGRNYGQRKGEHKAPGGADAHERKVSLEQSRRCLRPSGLAARRGPTSQHDNGHRWEGVAVVPSVVRSRSKPGAEFEPYLPPRSGGAPGPDISYRCPTRGVFRDPHAAAGKDPRILPRTSRSFCHPFLLLQDAGQTQNLRFQSSCSATGGEMAPGRAVFLTHATETATPRFGKGRPFVPSLEGSARDSAEPYLSGGPSSTMLPPISRARP